MTGTTGNYPWVRKYILRNNRIVDDIPGGTYQGVTTFDTNIKVSYAFVNGNVVNTDYLYLHPNPITDSFAYSSSYYNPYLAAGQNIWTLLSDDFTIPTRRGIPQTQSKKLFSFESYAQWNNYGGVYTMHPPATYTTVVTEAAAEDGILPKTVIRTYSNGGPEVAKFTYIKEH